MRHLWSFLGGVVVAPLTWVLVTLGQDGSTRTIDHWAEVGTYTAANLIEPAVYLAVAGILLGLLGTLRTSPAGPMTAGVLLVLPYIGMFVAPFGVRNRLPDNWKVFGDPLPLQLPVENGTLFLIGLMLLIATFSVQRWRRWPKPYSAAPTTETPSGDDQNRDLKDWPPPSSPPAAERDTAPVGLGRPDPTPTEPLPRRGGDSPWAAPPGAANTPDRAGR